MLTVQLEDLLGLRLLRQDDAVSFWAYLLNLEPWALATKLTSRERVDTQLVRSSIQWTDEHLRIGKQYAQFFSLLDSPGGSRPNLFGALQSIDANMILCSAMDSALTQRGPETNRPARRFRRHLPASTCWQSPPT